MDDRIFSPDHDTHGLSGIALLPVTEAHIGIEAVVGQADARPPGPHPLNDLSAFGPRLRCLSRPSPRPKTGLTWSGLL